jgi:hypothetical protein
VVPVGTDVAPGQYEVHAALEHGHLLVGLYRDPEGKAKALLLDEEEYAHATRALKNGWDAVLVLRP